MKMNFLNDYYKNRSQDQNASDIVNMYLEEDKSEGKYQVTAFPTPGLSAFNSGTGSVVRGALEFRGVFYAVVDNTLYSYASDGTRTSKGTLSTSTGRVVMDSITNQIMILDGTYGYNFNVDTSTFTTITDPDFPANPTYLAALDSVFYVASANSSAVYGSDIADGTSWSALSFASKTGPGDYINGLVENKGLFYVLGSGTSNTWYNSGAGTFSLESVGLGGFFNYGCAAPASIAKGNDVVFFLGQSKQGGKEVVMLQQYTPKVVSNRAVNYQINQLTTWSDAFGYCYRKSGHEFYVLTFPTDAVTFMLDITTGLWTTLKSYISSSYTRHLSNCYAYCYNKHLVGDFQSGKIYALDDTVYLDNGAQILRQITSPPGYANGKKLYCDSVQIDMETGVGSSLEMTLDVSKDSGRTYPSTYTGTIPTTGRRLYWSRLGMTQNAFVFKLSTTANAKVVVLGAQAEIRVGIN